MHGLINRSIQCFLRDTYGPALWARVAERARVGAGGFEAMLTYDDALTDSVLEAASHALSRPRDGLLEDLGTYLVSNPNFESLRRLLRFSGVSFEEFLQSLDDLPARGRLAVPELDLPQLELSDQGDGIYALTCTSPHRGFGHVMVGVLRAMADDYGALVLLDHAGTEGEAERIEIELLDRQFAEGRAFRLAAAAP
jgi:hypothetical protein